jgi:hypothetical protein
VTASPWKSSCSPRRRTWSQDEGLDPFRMSTPIVKCGIKEDMRRVKEKFEMRKPPSDLAQYSELLADIKNLCIPIQWVSWNQSRR